MRVSSPNGYAASASTHWHVERYQHRTRRRHQCIRTATRYREYQALMQLLKFLRCRGECPAARITTTAVDDLVAHYGQHLQDHQGLATVTIARHPTVANRSPHQPLRSR